jgi:hypothetical protein
MEQNIPSNSSLHHLKSLKEFFSYFIFHCSVIKAEDVINLALHVKPLGICTNKLYQIDFLEQLCVIDFIPIQENILKFFIYNSEE